MCESITMDLAHWHCYTFTVWIYFSSIIIISDSIDPPIMLHKLCSVFFSTWKFQFHFDHFALVCLRSSNFSFYMQSLHRYKWLTMKPKVYAMHKHIKYIYFNFNGHFQFIVEIIIIQYEISIFKSSYRNSHIIIIWAPFMENYLSRFLFRIFLFVSFEQNCKSITEIL